MASTLLGYPGVRWVDANGRPLSGGLVYTYTAGTSTAKSAYPTKADADAATNALSNPVVLNSGGQKQIWLDGTYKIIVKNAQGVTVDTVDSVGDASDSDTLPRNYIAGLTLSNAADADHDITVAIGECRDAADTADMALASAITKQIDATWAVGSAAGGMESGTTVGNSTLYAVWLIKRTDTGVVDMLFSASFTAPTMPTNYDVKRLIGSVLSNGSANIYAFTQVGDYFRYTGDVITDVTDNTITSNTFETATLSVPPSCMAHIYASFTNATSTNTSGVLTVRTKDAADAAGGAGEAWAFVQTAGNFDGVGNIGTVLVNASRQIEYTAEETDGTASVDIRTLGFTMLTRRDPL